MSTNGIIGFGIADYSKSYLFYVAQHRIAQHIIRSYQETLNSRQKHPAADAAMNLMDKTDSYFMNRISNLSQMVEQNKKKKSSDCASVEIEAYKSFIKSFMDAARLFKIDPVIIYDFLPFSQKEVNDLLIENLRVAEAPKASMDTMETAWNMSIYNLDRSNARRIAMMTIFSMISNAYEIAKDREIILDQLYMKHIQLEQKMMMIGTLCGKTEYLKEFSKNHLLKWNSSIIDLLQVDGLMPNMWKTSTSDKLFKAIQKA